MSSAKVELSYLICSALIFDLLMLASDGYWRVLGTGCSPVQGITIEYETRSAMVLQLVKELVDLHLPNLHICVTTGPNLFLNSPPLL